MKPDFNIYMDIQEAINLEMFRRFQEEGIDFAIRREPFMFKIKEREFNRLHEKNPNFSIFHLCCIIDFSLNGLAARRGRRRNRSNTAFVVRVAFCRHSLSIALMPLIVRASGIIISKVSAFWRLFSPYLFCFFRLTPS